MTKHTIVIEFESTPKLTVPAVDLVADRVWTVDGVVMNTVVARVVGKDVVIVSRFEYDSMRERIKHLENPGG